MTGRAAFDPNDPFDGLAELAKREVAEGGLRILNSPEYKRFANDYSSIQAVLAGVITGAIGIAMAQFEPSDESHIELRAVIAAYLPQAFDQARSISGLPPLPRANQ